MPDAGTASAEDAGWSAASAKMKLPLVADLEKNEQCATDSHSQESSAVVGASEKKQQSAAGVTAAAAAVVGAAVRTSVETFADVSYTALAQLTAISWHQRHCVVWAMLVRDSQHGVNKPN